MKGGNYIIRYILIISKKIYTSCGTCVYSFIISKYFVISKYMQFTVSEQNLKIEDIYFFLKTLNIKTLLLIDSMDNILSKTTVAREKKKTLNKIDISVTFVT